MRDWEWGEGLGIGKFKGELKNLKKLNIMKNNINKFEYKLLKGRGIARIALGSSDEACTVRVPANVPKNSLIMATLL